MSVFVLAWVWIQVFCHLALLCQSSHLTVPGKKEWPFLGCHDFMLCGLGYYSISVISLDSSHIILTNHLDCAWKGGSLSWRWMDDRDSQKKREWWQYQGIVSIHVSEFVAIRMSLAGYWGCLPLQVGEKSCLLFLTHRLLNIVVNLYKVLPEHTSVSSEVPGRAKLVPYTEHETGKRTEKAHFFSPANNLTSFSFSFFHEIHLFGLLWLIQIGYLLSDKRIAIICHVANLS